MPETPSLDPRRTVDHTPSPEAPPVVADTGAGRPAGPTEPYCSAPPADAPSIPGYRVTAEIARGGMGRVYAAHDLTLDREVAIKTLLPGADAERFVIEAKITARLPHPGIPPVHALGTLADGTPYLAMKLIRGRTLAALLNQRPSPFHELPRFVQVFEQVAQAVGFAHAQGVIHRDLKPLNVMVGTFGEVQVMDWGLAKDIVNGDQERPEERPEAVNVTQTAAGAVMGTPGYMAPEQARGEAVDARADVFALGATLAAILTGRPAFVGAGGPEVIDRAARADLAEVRQRLANSGADGELIALALRCLSADAAARPADGRAVAAEVGAYRAGVEARLKQAETERAEALVREGEQRKRRRTVLAAGAVVAAVLLAGLGVSLWQMSRAVAAEGQANQNAQQARDEANAKDVALKAEQQARADETRARQQAFAALRSMTAVVVERKFAQGTALTDDDRAFLRDVIAQYDAFAEIKGDDADSRAARAEGRLEVGLIRYRLGELREAEQDYDQALSIYTPLAADSPDRPEFRRDLAVSHLRRSRLLGDTGRLKKAEQEIDQALSIQMQLAADFPSRSDSRRDLAGSHNNRANLLSATGRLKEAEQDYDQALSIRKQLVADFPSRTDFRKDLADSHYNRGALLYTTGRLHDAEQGFDQALSIYTQLAADFPSRPDFRLALAKSHNYRGLLHSTTGRLRAAEKDYDQALSIFKQMAAAFPSRPDLRQELAIGHGDRGIFLSKTGRLQEAEQDYDEALSIQKQLAADFPNQPGLRNAVAGTCVNLAGLHAMQLNWAAAKRLLLEGRPYHLAALKANPTHPAYRQFYRNHLGVLTQVHAGLLEQDDAIRTAEARHDLGWDAPGDAYDAACVLSLCIPIAAKHDKLDDKQRKEAVQVYGDAAMRLLREAVGKGYKDVPHMKKDTDLDPLRQREDFQRLIAELEGKGK
jgi:tetratricopeptide (TPR) repeat protein